MLTGNGTLIINSYPDPYVVHGKFLPSKVKNKRLFSGSKCCNDYKDSNCFMLYDDGTLYSGECLDDEPHGYGWMVYDRRHNSDLMKYVGNWYKGKKNGQGQQFYNDKSVYYGKFKNDSLHEEGLMMMSDGSCSKVTIKNSIIDEYNFLSSNKSFCSYEILGKKTYKKSKETYICDNLDGIDATRYHNDVIDVEGDVIEYNVNHCNDLKGRHCNQEIMFYGSLNERSERNDTGYLKFKDGKFYYGDFLYDQMHGRGVTKFKHEKLESGHFSFGKFLQGIQLVSNLTVIANQKLSGKV